MKVNYLILLLNFSLAGTLLVPNDYSTIQAAIDYSEDGDTISVAAGTYVENISLNKTIVLMSSEGADNTISLPSFIIYSVPVLLFFQFHFLSQQLYDLF